MMNTNIQTFDHSDFPEQSALMRQSYQDQGILIIKGLLDSSYLESFKQNLKAVIQTRLKTLSIAYAPTDTLDALLSTLLRENNRLAMDIIRVAKNLPDYYAAFSNPNILKLAKLCMNSEALYAVHDLSQIRIDPPHDFERNFNWHQDYPYNMAGLNSLTAWFPLTGLSSDMGYLKVLPASHNAIKPIQLHRHKKVSGRGTSHNAASLDHNQNEIYEREGIEIENVQPGDVVFFHCLLLHRSGLNRSKKTRWVINPRFSDTCDHSVAGKGWITVCDKVDNLFEKEHPDMILH